MCTSLYAQETKGDSLIRLALLLKSVAGTGSLPNHDSLFRRLTLTQSADERIDLVNKIINNGLDISSEGLAYHYKILDWSKKNKDPLIEAVIIANIGYNIYMNGNSEDGVRLGFTALKQAQKIGNNRVIGIVYENLGVCFRSQRQLELEYLHTALSFSKAGEDEVYVYWELFDLGGVHEKLNNTDSAGFYYFKSLEWVVKNNLVSFVPYVLVGLAGVEKNEVYKFNYLSAAMQSAIQLNENSALLSIYNALGDYYLANNKRDSAFYYAKKAYNISQGFSLSSQLPPAKLLSTLFKNLNADSALKYTDIYLTIKDSVENRANIERAQTQAFLYERQKLQVETEKKALQTNRRFTLLITAIGFLLLLALVFWRNDRKNKTANRLLKEQKEKIQETLQELKATQSQLIQSEKMASLGELTAGIAHEIQNPLNFVNNFSEVNKELLAEMNDEIEKGNLKEVKSIAKDISDNEEKINHHGKRADAIVKGMLQHSRSSSAAAKEPTDINKLADEYLRLAYHGLRAKDKSFNATLKTDYDETIGNINIIPQDIGRVVLNLITNAFYAVDEKKKSGAENLPTGQAGYEPTVTVSTKKLNDKTEIRVTDNGNGIPQKVLDKIFQPFFTTKPTGKGTGLGLAVCYGIITAHGGQIEVSENNARGTKFVILLPANTSI